MLLFARALGQLKPFFLLALVLGPALSARAESDSATLNAILQSMSSLQADFSQQSYDNKGRPQQTLSGQMAVKRPGFFRWDTTAPSAQLIVANGNQVWIYDPELEQATRQKLDKQVGNTPALLLSGNAAQIDAAFTITRDTQSGADTIFTLKPRDKEAVFASLRVAFHGRELTAMSLQDNLGQKTEIHFDKVKLNSSLAGSLFEFTPPKGTDVIDEGP